MEIVILAVLAILVVGAVVAPLFAGRRTHPADEAEYALRPVMPPTAVPGQPAGGAAVASTAVAPDEIPVEPGQVAALEAEVARYRAALIAGTLCGRCGEANPANARFCQECGKALPAADAQEFAP